MVNPTQKNGLVVEVVNTNWFLPGLIGLPVPTLLQFGPL